jgi:hypothetical protein
MRFWLLAVLLIAAPAAHAGVLGADELRGVLVGQPIQWWERDGWQSGSLTLLPDGRAEISIESPDTAADSGRWTISGNQLCTVWSMMRDRQSKCYSVEQVAPNRFVTSGGNVFVIMTAGV